MFIFRPVSIQTEDTFVSLRNLYPGAAYDIKVSFIKVIPYLDINSNALIINLPILLQKPYPRISFYLSRLNETPNLVKLCICDSDFSSNWRSLEVCKPKNMKRPLGSWKENEVACVVLFSQ